MVIEGFTFLADGEILTFGAFIANANDGMNSTYFASEVLMNEFIFDILKVFNIFVDLFFDERNKSSHSFVNQSGN